MKFESALVKIVFPFLYYPRVLKNIYLFSFRHRRDIDFLHNGETFLVMYRKYEAQKNNVIRRGMHPILAQMQFIHNLSSFYSLVEVHDAAQRFKKRMERLMKENDSIKEATKE